MEPIKKHDKRHLDTMPTGSLGIIPITGCEEMASEIDFYLTRWRAERESEHKDSLAYTTTARPTRCSTSQITCPRTITTRISRE